MLPNSKGDGVEGMLGWKETAVFTNYGLNTPLLQFYDDMDTFLGPSQELGQDSCPVCDYNDENHRGNWN